MRCLCCWGRPRPLMGSPSALSQEGVLAFTDAKVVTIALLEVSSFFLLLSIRFPCLTSDVSLRNLQLKTLVCLKSHCHDYRILVSQAEPRRNSYSAFWGVLDGRLGFSVKRGNCLPVCFCFRCNYSVTNASSLCNNCYAALS